MNNARYCTPDESGYQVAVVAEVLSRIAPDCELDVRPDGVTQGNAGALVSGCDALIDGVDLYALERKRDVFEHAYDEAIPVFSSPVLGFGTALGIFDARRSPRFEQVFGPLPATEDSDARDRYIRSIGLFFFGFRPPVDWSCFMERVYAGAVPSVGPACLLSGAWVASAIADVLGNRHHLPSVPVTLHFDMRSGKLVRVGPLRRRILRIAMRMAR